MAQYCCEENIAQLRAITGDKNNNRYLYHQLRDGFKRASSIDIMVSFLMDSGIKLLIPDLKNALDNGARIRILTSRYLQITEPSALFRLKSEFGERIDLRFVTTPPEQSFHAKAYFLHFNNSDEVFIGSSNLSLSALTDGIEWNYRVRSNEDREGYNTFYSTFKELYDHHSVVIDDDVLKVYSASYHKPLIVKQFSEYEELNTTPIATIEPKGAQIEALYALERSRNEGADKALIQAATGIGKTYLAAFDSKAYKHVLFVAHREEILNQAAKSFRAVRQSNDIGFFNGNVHDTDKALIFASVGSLGKEEFLNPGYFQPDYFDYIVIDEFHHAVNKYYLNIIGYFKPKFLLGLTATPERTDGRNIYEICDYNVPYEITLFQAINRGLLVPFHYYGVFDETDYSSLKFSGGDYKEEELNTIYINNVKRDNLIIKHFNKYEPKHALGFCCSRLHAEYMAKVFSKNGIPAVAVYSSANGKYSLDRKAAIEKLEKGEIKIIFSVDMFNEGVDIPSVDTVLFLRPTESEIVFLQQLGRGLRLAEGKEYLNVIDLIGNYKYAGKTIALLTQSNRSSIADIIHHKATLPDGCVLDFNLDLIDLFSEMEKRHTSIKELIDNEFYRIKGYLNRVPSRMDLFTYMDKEVYELCLNRPKDNPFRDYLSYLNRLGELNKAEEGLLHSIGKDFINEIEKTSMTKSYKMPILLSFLNGSSLKASVTEKELLTAWKSFFNKNGNWKDLPKVESYLQYKQISDKEHLDNIKKNPVHFLEQSASAFFIKKGSIPIALTDPLLPLLNNEALVAHYKDAVEYRTKHYYMRKYHEEKERLISYSFDNNSLSSKVAEEDISYTTS